MQNEAQEKKIGQEGFVNRKCWLANSAGRPPSKRCQYCASKFSDCLFFRYLAVSLILVVLVLVGSFIMEGVISKAVVLSIFLLVIVYGYFFNKSTEDIIIANFRQKKATDDLEVLANNLQQKVEEQTKDIKTAYDVEKRAREVLQRTDCAKSQFMALANHHLRTPLTTINWYSEFLLSGKYGKISKKTKEIVEKIKQSAIEEIGVVDDLLNISQMQLNGEVIKTKVKMDLENVLEQIEKNAKVAAEKKNISFNFNKTGTAPLIMGDACKLKMAIENIVDNAIKYTEKGSVDVNVEVDPRVVKISVKDTGIGLSEEDLENIFGKTFERGEEAQKMFATGKGIGLYLSSKIIEAHNGKIWGKSEGRGKGSTFIIEFPVADK